MISSIYKVWKAARSGNEDASLSSGATQPCLTRANFLRGITAGALVAGVALTTDRAVAAKAKRIKPVTDIDKLYDAWQDRFNAGDLDALVDLYTSDVTYVDPEGKQMVGKSKVRENLAGIIGLKPHIILGERKHLLYRDVALTTNHWKLTIPNADGTNQELTGGGIEVLKKQADGGWRYIIDDASRSAS